MTASPFDSAARLIAVPTGAGTVAAGNATLGTETRTILLVEQREFLRSCLQSWLQSLGDEFDVTGVAALDRSIDFDTPVNIDIAVLSVGLASLSSPWPQDQATWIRTQWPAAPIVMIAEPSSPGRLYAFIRSARLQGYISTSSSPKVAALALRLVSAGGTYIPSELVGGETAATAGADAPELVPAAPDGARSALSTLTPRERSVLESLQCGMPNKTIAFQLRMSQSTVKVHVHNIMKKLKARNRTEAAVIARAVAGGNGFAAMQHHRPPPPPIAVAALAILSSAMGAIGFC